MGGNKRVPALIADAIYPHKMSCRGPHKLPHTHRPHMGYGTGVKTGFHVGQVPHFFGKTVHAKDLSDMRQVGKTSFHTGLKLFPNTLLGPHPSGGCQKLVRFLDGLKFPVDFFFLFGKQPGGMLPGMDAL